MFSFSKVDQFDSHIRNSIPGYELLVEDIIQLSKSFIEPRTSVLDIGCSTGTMLWYLANKVNIDADYKGIDIVQTQEWKTLQSKFGPITGTLKFVERDARELFVADQFSFVMSLFTLQFIPVSDRRKLLRQIKNYITPDGAFVFSEKVLSVNPKIQDCLTFMHYDFKSAAFTEKEILDKERELRDCMRLMTIEQIQESIKLAGFKTCDTFWQQNNFVGFIALP